MAKNVIYQTTPTPNGANTCIPLTATEDTRTKKIAVNNQAVLAIVF